MVALRGPGGRLVCHAPVEPHHTLHSGTVELRPRDDRGVALRVVNTRVRAFVFPRGEHCGFEIIYEPMIESYIYICRPFEVAAVQSCH